MNLRYILPLLIGAATLSGCGVANNPTVCTTAPESEWLNQEQFQAGLLADGYQIREFKVTEGNCYEIYGSDANGAKVEIYFNPVDGAIVKQETH
jgi:hypothetical protein